MRRRIAYVLVISAAVLTERTAHADPTVAECLAASDASATLARDHRLLAERAQLLVCAATSCPVDIRKDCVSHVDEVNGQIPTIVFEAKDGSGMDINAVKVTMDGQPLTEKLDGTALSIDPGEHSFTFQMVGQPVVTKSFTIQQSQKDRHEAIMLGPPAPAPGLPALPGPAASTGLGTQRIVALGTGGIGLVGVAVGAAFGAIAMSDKSSAKNACPGATCPTPAGSDKWSSAEKAGNVSTVGFIVGGVALAGAATLWFTARSGASAPRAQVGLGPGMLQVRGSW
jgi:hypothetical protein